MGMLRKYRELLALMLSWVVVGIYLGPLIYIYLPVTLLFLRARNMYMELLIGFFFMLIVSDSRADALEFAASTKEIYVIMLALFLFLDSKRFGTFSRLYVWFIPFFLIAVICFFNAPSDIFVDSIQKTLSYFLLIFVVPNYVQYSHNNHKEEFYKTLIYFGIFILLVGFIFKYISYDISYMEGRYRGIFGNPNGLGVFCLLFFMLFSLITNLYPDLFKRNEKILVYVLVFLSIIAGGSRSTLFAVLLFLFFSYFYKISPFLGFIIFLIIAGSYGYVTNNLIGIVDNLGLQRYLRVETLEAGSGRFVAWNFALGYIRESIFLGHGFEYTNYIFDMNGHYLEMMGHQGNAHNSYITLWLDTGLLGLIAYVVSLSGSFVKAARKTRLALPILYATVFSSFFESWLTASLNPFTILLFIIMSILASDVIVKPKAEAAIPV